MRMGVGLYLEFRKEATVLVLPVHAFTCAYNPCIRNFTEPSSALGAGAGLLHKKKPLPHHWLSFKFKPRGILYKYIFITTPIVSALKNYYIYRAF
jgi:hypothetical protein